ncbi:hypothetical protein SAMN05660359_04741 [Geodermatophilus obscurus]|uniref:Major Facilitator Superfamily protein n=1 Tax=Geodermatophilus obscurus TaxID=1861 RepID=A0A1I5INP6_9ACTN|nr:hypothetical protein SAMN05660359_04741 [Geodermatophilus obscurus]
MALLVALGVDNAGSGLFLPLVLAYCTEAVGLSLAVAGTVVSVGIAMGLVVPAVAGRVVDRLGPKAVVVASQVLQAGGLLAYLLAQDVIGVAVAVAAALTAVRLQLFYSALFALIAPSSLVSAWLLASTLVLAASSLLVGTRPNAVAEAAAPVQLRGRYLAMFQYAFTDPQLAEPLVMAMSAVHPVLPWVTTAATTTAGLGLLPWLARRLPTCAVQPTG